MLYFVRRNARSELLINFVPPSLHIRLGIFNKLLKALDAVLVAWNRKHKWDKTPEGSISPAMDHLELSLSEAGASRERYYAGDLSGVP